MTYLWTCVGNELATNDGYLMHACSMHDSSKVRADAPEYKVESSVSKAPIVREQQFEGSHSMTWWMPASG